MYKRQVHEPIIERAVFEQVQQKRGKMRKRQAKEDVYKRQGILCGTKIIVFGVRVSNRQTVGRSYGREPVAAVVCENYALPRG